MKPKRKPRPIRCPMIVAKHLAPEAEIAERMALQGFMSGYAGEAQFNVLANVCDLLALGAERKGDVAIAAVCEASANALHSIKARYARLDKMGANGDELKALRAMVDIADAWWKRQSPLLFETAHAELDRARVAELEQNRADHIGEANKMVRT